MARRISKHQKNWDDVLLCVEFDPLFGRCAVAILSQSIRTTSRFVTSRSSEVLRLNATNNVTFDSNFAIVVGEKGKSMHSVVFAISKILRLTAVAIASVVIATPSQFARAEVVGDWLSVQSKALSASPRGQAARATTLMSLAMFNSLNAISPRYAFYGAPIESVQEASPDAAAAMAAFTILASVPNADLAALTKALDESIKSVADAHAKEKGLALGRRAAYALLSARANDSLTRVEPAKREPAAGVYELTTEHKTESSIALSRVRPFAISNPFAYDPGPPPALDSAVAKRDLAEVKALGAHNSTTRSADQSVAALFWNSGEDGDGIDLFKRIAEARKLSSLDFARMVALADMADYDGRIVYVAIKEKYRYWRPANAIAGKFADPATRDLSWKPLIATPPNPDYPSGGGVGGGAMFALLTEFNPNNAATLSWKNTAVSVTRSWPDAAAMAQELAHSRIWGGVHFRNSVEVGYRIGKRVSEDVFASQLQPLAQ
jgi:hypothetical protein